MSTIAIPAVTAAPKVSWLKHLGNFLGKILKITAKNAPPIADMAAKVAEVMFPQFAAGIAVADNLVDNIAKEALAAEIMEQAGAAAQGGPAKLQAVLANVGPAIDQWIASRFPGSNTVASAKKANLVSAIVDIVNDVTPPSTLVVPAATPAK
jgi:hypothetical protein